MLVIDLLGVGVRSRQDACFEGHPLDTAPRFLLLLVLLLPLRWALALGARYWCLWKYCFLELVLHLALPVPVPLVELHAESVDLGFQYQRQA